MKKIYAALMLLATGPALAVDSPTAGSHIDGYYSNLELKLKADGLGSETIDGDGGGLRMWMGNGWGVFTADVQTDNLSKTVDGLKVKIDADIYRVGMGARLIRRQEGEAWIRAEYVRANLDGNASFEGSDLGSASDEQEGYGIHAGGMLNHGIFHGYAEIGRIELEDLDGMEYTVGINIQPGMVGGFVEYRFTDLELDDFDADEEYTDIRAGVRIGF